MALTINGTTGISGVDGSASAPVLSGTDSNTGITFGSDIMGFATGGVERLKITSIGRLGINEGTPESALHITGSSAEASKILLRRSGADAEFGISANGHLTLKALGTSGVNGQIRGFVAGEMMFRCDLAGRFVLGEPTINTSIDHSLVAQGRVQTNGTYSVTGSGGSPVRILTTGLLIRQSSSSKYKKDIADATWGLADVLKLRPVTFKSNATGEEADDQTYGGLIAEEVHDTGLTNFVEYNDNNEPEGVNYSLMVALMAKSIQELSAKVTTLETKVAALEAA